MKQKKIEKPPRKRGYWDNKVADLPVGEGFEDVTESEYLCIYRALKKQGCESQRQKMKNGKFRVWRIK